MKRSVTALIAAVFLCLGSVAMAGGPATSSQKAGNLSEDKGAASATAEAVDASNLAARLAAYARTQKSPLSLGAAAQILADIPMQDKQQQKSDEGGKPVASVPGEAFPDAAALFAEAVALAKEQQNPALADLLGKQAEAAGQTKGRVGGPARHVDSVKPGSTDVYEIRFRGSERAMIGAKSRNGEDIDIVVLDENHNEICRDYDNDGVPVCRWTPKWTGQFYIKIKNRTNGTVRYELVTS